MSDLATRLRSGCYSPGDVIAAADAIDAARGVVKPFACDAERYEPDERDDDHDAWDSMFTIGSLRRARDWLAKHGDPNG
jgi:hypothetical protein